MRKNTVFTGQPIFSQILRLITSDITRKAASQHKADRYYKKFRSRDHLIAMIFTAFNRISSLRELVTGLQAWDNRLMHLGMTNFPRRSTLSDANKSRPEEFFSDVYQLLYKKYYPHLPDSRKEEGLEERMFLMDSTTMDLFSEVMYGVGRKPLTGKRKGGVKAHVLMNASEDFAQVIRITAARCNDRIFMNNIVLPPKSILVFDKGYVNYKKWKEWHENKIFWVTRANNNAYFERTKRLPVSGKRKNAGVICDEIGMMGRSENTNTTLIQVRRIEYFDAESKRKLVFITNHTKFSPLTIAHIYKKRWQVESFFKRLKQNYPLRNFLGDNERAIRIQIWCSLITDLLVKIIKDKIAGRKWAYSNLAGFLRLHLGTYIDMRRFLNNPEKELEIQCKESVNMSLFSP